MNLNKILQWGLLLLLTACGHGYEGEYTEQVGSANELLNAVAQVVGNKTVVIGRDYLDADGKRTQYEDIFVRESGSQQYLVFKSAQNTEEVWKIVDKDTLLQGSELVSMTLRRVHQ